MRMRMTMSVVCDDVLCGFAYSRFSAVSFKAFDAVVSEKSPFEATSSKFASISIMGRLGLRLGHNFPEETGHPSLVWLSSCLVVTYVLFPLQLCLMKRIRRIAEGSKG